MPAWNDTISWLKEEIMYPVILEVDEKYVSLLIGNDEITFAGYLNDE